MSKTYEVEIKSLLGGKDEADRLIESLKKTYKDIEIVAEEKQLNHYFTAPSDLALLIKNVDTYIPKEKRDSFEHLITHGNKMSIRTRDADGKVILVIKASVGADTSSNGVKRIEFESVVDISLAELDKVLLDSGCAYQAKWSRERKEYGVKDMHICIDKNAGYGYVAEFERLSQDESKLDEVRKELLEAMASLGVSELPQDRLERMFAHYNAHWSEYYGTERTFIIE